MKIYYNHLDLIKDLQEAINTEVESVFRCSMNLYVLDQYFYSSERGFNFWRDKLHQVEYSKKGIQIITGITLLGRNDVIFTSFGFIPKIFENNKTDLYYCFTRNQLLNVLLKFQKQELNEKIMRVNAKYEGFIKEVRESWIKEDERDNSVE